MLTKWSKEERFGLQVTFGFHVLLFLFLLFVKLDTPEDQRTAFIEVDLGAFQMGSPAEYAPKKNQQVESRKVTSPNQSNERPKENKPETQQNTQKSVDKTKPVDAPDQTEPVVSDEVVKTPETEKITPETSDKQQVKEEAIAPDVKKDEVEKDGEVKTGDTEGLKGDANVKQGTGTDEDKTAPFSLKWEGDIERSPQVQPLPSYNEDLEAVITIRFEVRPDGTVARMIPLKKMNPNLESEVLKTLRTWRFSRLPSGVPQKSQWGTITFRFVLQ
ncbi:TonB family protein [bacterium]|nr:MAG: TonB family protein [bacterium]